MRYTFKEIRNCNMCGSSTSTHKVLGRRLNRSQGKHPKGKIGITTTICKCSDCGLIYSNPQPIPGDIQDHYGVPPEDYWKPSYFEVNEHYFQSELSRFKELTLFKSGMKSLDIGAGLGKQMTVLERAGFDTYGFEPSGPFHERAINKMGIASSKLKLGSIEEVDYDENMFDFISFGAVLEHLYDPSAAIVKALKWTKLNGLIHIEVPSSDWLINKMINAYYKLRMSDHVGNLSPMHEPYHLYEFALSSFKKNAQVNNYEVAFHEYFICQTYMPSILDGILRSYMKSTDQGMQLSIWLRKTANSGSKV